MDVLLQHSNLKQITIDGLIAWRQAREKLIERVNSFPVASPIGPLQGHAYRSPFDPVYHVAFVYGAIGKGRDVLTRFHKQSIIGDVQSAGSAGKVKRALDRFKSEGRGVLVYLRDGAAGLPTRYASHENFRIFQAANLDGDFPGLLKCICGKSARKNDSSLLGCILVPLECCISTDASRECAYSTNLEHSDLAARVSLKGPFAWPGAHKRPRDFRSCSPVFSKFWSH
ncbi:hypothetical protein ACVWW4_000106 [Bradyrhizobium sp. LB7.1]